MQKLRNKIQEKKAELKLDNAELGLAIGRGERYIDRLLRDTVSTAKQEEIIGVLDGLSCSSLAARLQIHSYLAEKSLASKNSEVLALKIQHESTKNELRKPTISTGNMAEQLDRSAKQLAASVAQNERLKEQIKNMAMQLMNVELDNKELQGDIDSAKFNLNAEKTSNLRECGIMKIKHSRELAAKNKQLNFARFICALLTLVLFLVIALASIQW